MYEKARITISGKLAAMNPPLPEGVVAKQKQALEEAIVQVEKEYARSKPADPFSELESVFASLKNPAPRIPPRDTAANAAVRLRLTTLQANVKNLTHQVEKLGPSPHRLRMLETLRETADELPSLAGLVARFN